MTYFRHLIEKGWDYCSALEWTKQLRSRLAGNQNWRCCYCGISMQDTKASKTDFVTLEHVVPISWGGPNTEDNLVAACHKCNSTRGNAFFAVHLDLYKIYQSGDLA